MFRPEIEIAFVVGLFVGGWLYHGCTVARRWAGDYVRRPTVFPKREPEL